MKYADGTNQVLSIYVTKPAAEVVSDLGRFPFTKQWHENPNDPFKRSPSIMSYDRAKNRIVDQDARVDRGAGRRRRLGLVARGRDETVRSADEGRGRAA